MMSTRFLGNLGLIVAGSVLVAVSLAFTPWVIGWVAFGVALTIVALLGLLQLDRGRGIVQQALDAVTSMLAIGTVVTSVVFSGGTVKWLTFGEAIGLFAIAAIGLIAHELKTERVVYSLEAAGERERAEHYSRAA